MTMTQLFLSLVQAVSLVLVVAYLFCRTPAFRRMFAGQVGRSHWMMLWLFFSGLSLLGNFFGLPIHGALANTRDIGPVLAGVIGGPALGLAVGLVGGLQRYSLGGVTALSCGLSTLMAGLMGGAVHLRERRRGVRGPLLAPGPVLVAMVAAEIFQNVVLLVVMHSAPHAVALLRELALPSLVANTFGAVLFVSILQDRIRTLEAVGVLFAERALKVAELALAVLGRGFDVEVAGELALLIQRELNVEAVAITDTTHLLAFVDARTGSHSAGVPITSIHTRQAIEAASVVLAEDREGIRRSLLVIPLKGDDGVIGTINLYEPIRKPFLGVNRAMGEGLAAILSSQLLRTRCQEQKHLLTLAELRLARAQVDPHFLFNALNVIHAVARKDAAKACGLIQHLSAFFRKNLKRAGEFSTLGEELEHVCAYLEIAKARYEERLTVEIQVEAALLGTRLPVWSLQPLVENAIKHGIADMLTPGVARITACRDGDTVRVDVEDSAGTYLEREAQPSEPGLGLGLVDRRVKALMGVSFGLKVSCVPYELTRVSLWLPYEVSS